MTVMTDLIASDLMDVFLRIRNSAYSVFTKYQKLQNFAY